jgi:hypothetical protein
MSNLISSEVGLIVSKSPNVNAVYGPWESLDQATKFLEENFTIWDDDYNEVVDIPTGTTVGVYDDLSKQTVTEYWWTSGQLILKTYGNNYFELVVDSEEGYPVNAIYLGENKINTPMYLFPKRIDHSKNSIVTTGYIRYSFSKDNWEIYVDNSEGIPTSLITNMCMIEWKDDDDKLIASKSITVNTLSQITQTFYAYNNDVNNHPKYVGESGINYQNTDWTPND